MLHLTQASLSNYYNNYNLVIIIWSVFHSFVQIPTILIHSEPSFLIFLEWVSLQTQINPLHSHSCLYWKGAPIYQACLGIHTLAQDVLFGGRLHNFSSSLSAARLVCQKL